LLCDEPNATPLLLATDEREREEFCQCPAARESGSYVEPEAHTDENESRTKPARVDELRTGGLVTRG
jgi:hypothetical protein